LLYFDNVEKYYGQKEACPVWKTCMGMGFARVARQRTLSDSAKHLSREPAFTG